MWRNSKPFLIMTSVALNVAFVAVWFVHAISAGTDGDIVSDPPETAGRIWCPLHQKLEVSEEQWERIEPRLKEFRESARAGCQHVSKLRGEMVDLIAEPNPDLDAIDAKQREIQAGQQKMQALVISHLLAEKEILTAEQEQRLFAMIREQTGCNQNGPMMMPGRVRRGVGRVFRDKGPSD